jgi:hypothetical protein
MDETPEYSLLFTDRYKIDEEFKKHIARNPEIVYCVLNFLSWLPTTELGVEVIKKLYKELKKTN